jgi:hypothetical protein
VGTTNPTANLQVNGTFSARTTNGVQGLYQGATGNVGIGYASPASVFHVRNMSNDTSDWGIPSLVTLENTSNVSGAWSSIQFNGNTGQIQTGIRNVQYDVGNAYGRLAFATRGASGWNGEAMTISNSNIGMGRTSPQTKLHVVGTGSFTNVGVGTTTTYNTLQVVGSAAIGTSAYQVVAPTSGLLVQGNVGIGSTAPANKLDVNGNVFVNGNIGIGTTATGTGRLVVSGGNVGIGTTLPSAALQVVGNVKATANLDPSYIEYWGANNTTDSKTAIQNAADYCQANGCAVKSAGGSFLLASGPVYFLPDSNETVNIELGNALFRVDNNPALAIGIGTSASQTKYGKIELPMMVNLDHNYGDGWAGDGIAVKIINAEGCSITAREIRHFATGLWMTAYGSQGNVENNIYVGRLGNNKINLLSQPDDEAGWVNQNTYYGGKYWMDEVEEGTGNSGAAHIKLLPHLVSSSDSLWPSQNVFINPSLEDDAVEYSVVMSGNDNALIFPRIEADSPKIMYFGGDGTGDNKATYGNMVFGGYGTPLQPIEIGRIRRNSYIGYDGIGIGTAYPQASLDVQDTLAGNIVGLKIFNDEWSTDNSTSIDMSNTDGTAEASIVGKYKSGGHVTDLEFKTHNDTSLATRMIIKGAGNVGIGTTAPTSRFHVNSTTTAQVTIQGNSAGGCIMLYDTDAAGWTECDALNGTLSCSTDADGVCD